MKIKLLGTVTSLSFEPVQYFRPNILTLKPKGKEIKKTKQLSDTVH